ATAAASVAAAMAAAPRPGRAIERPSFNAAIDEAWQAGLAILKPTLLELERGLRLHAESLVFDCYGFAPRSALDGEAIAKAMVATVSISRATACRSRPISTRCPKSCDSSGSFINSASA